MGVNVKKYLKEQEAADFLGLQRQTLTRWRWAGTGPKFHKVGHSVRYTIEDLEHFVEVSR